MTRPCRGATLIGNCLAGAGGDRRGRQRLRDEDRDLRQGRPERPGRHRPGPRPGRGDDRRGDRGLIELGRARGRGGARAPAPPTPRPSRPRPSEREVRVHGGEVESLTAATQRGIGLRAWIGGRVGFAFGTDLGEAGIAALAARAVEAARAADEDEFAGPPRPAAEPPDARRARATPRSSPGRRPRSPSSRSPSSARRCAADAARRRGRAAVYADAAERVAIASSTGISGEYESSSCYAYAQALAKGDDGDRDRARLRPGPRARPRSTRRPSAARRAERAAAMIGAGKPESRSLPRRPRPDRRRQLRRPDRRRARRRRGPARPLAVRRAGSARRSAPRPSILARRRPRSPAAPPPRRSTARASRGARTPLIEAGAPAHLPLRHLHGAARRGRARPATPAAPATAACRASRPPTSSSPTGELDLDGLLGRGRRTGSSSPTSPASTPGVNPVTGVFSVGASGRAIRGGELAEPVREFTIASDLVSMLRRRAGGRRGAALGPVRRLGQHAAAADRRDDRRRRLSAWLLTWAERVWRRGRC